MHLPTAIFGACHATSIDVVYINMIDRRRLDIALWRLNNRRVSITIVVSNSNLNDTISVVYVWNSHYGMLVSEYGTEYLFIDVQLCSYYLLSDLHTCNTIYPFSVVLFFTMDEELLIFRVT